MADVLHVHSRETRGTKRMRRLRQAGQIPLVLYGHGKPSKSLAADTRDVENLMRHGGHIVELQGAAKENALVKEVQWDAFGSQVLHLDLTRVDVSEAVEVKLSVELRGDAPGSHLGGIVKQQLHELTVRCPADQLPERLELSINSLELDGVLTAGDVPLPAAASLIGQPEDVVVHCMVVSVEEEEVEEEEAAATAAEPEVIGRKPEEEEQD